MGKAAHTNDRQDDTSPRQCERRPFDTRQLADFPLPDERDPPYRSWWVATDDDDDGRDGHNA